MLLLLLYPQSAKPAGQLYPTAEISIMTCGPGTDMYALYGHTAIRVKDPALGMDQIYNYGTFYPGEENFMWLFIRGKAEYLLSVEPYVSFYATYATHENRSISQQVLNLTSEEKQQLYDLLVENYQPQNRAYVYDFFFDNCATRVRDIIPKAMQGKVTFQEQADTKSTTFRKLIQPYHEPYPWLDFGIDLLLGIPVDKQASVNDKMFLPEHLERIFSTAKHTDGRALTQSSKAIYIPVEVSNGGFEVTPLLVFALLFFCIGALTVLEWKRKLRFIWLDRIILSLFGLIGIFVLFMWFGTDHASTKLNLNILWLFPPHLVMAWVMRKKRQKIEKFYFLGTFILSLVLLVSFPFFVQQFHPAVIPFLGILAARSARIYWLNK